MSDIVERLEEPELHYPGNFDTPKRANAMLSCLCQEAKWEIESLRQQLAEKDAEIDRLKSQIGIHQSGLQRSEKFLHEQLAASQLREQQYREAIEATCCDPEEKICIDGSQEDRCILQDAISLQQDTSALQSLIAKAGEVMRERCARYCETLAGYEAADEQEWASRIRDLPSVTLEDLQK